MITRNVRNAILLLVALFTLNSCIEEGDSITESMGYGTIVDYNGSKLMVLENDYYGTVSATLRPTDETASTIANYDAGTRVIVSYSINWNQQTDYTTTGILDADLTLSRTWTTGEMVDNSSLEVVEPFASDSIEALLAPFITYNSNGNSIITTAGIMQGIASGGNNYTLDLVRPATYDSENLTDTLYIVLNEGDIDTSKDNTVEYKSYLLPSNLYQGDEVNIIVRFIAKSVTGYYSIGYLDDDNQEAYFSLTYEDPYFED